MSGNMAINIAKLQEQLVKNKTMYSGNNENTSSTIDANDNVSIKGSA